MASTFADLLPYGRYRIEKSNAPEGYLTDDAEPIEFEITEDGKIVDLTGTSIYPYNAEAELMPISWKTPTTEGQTWSGT